MVISDMLRAIALSLPGTREKPHFDRAAFSVDRIYATLDSSGLSANLKFTPDEQDFKCQLAPDIFSPIDNAWGRQGWTTMSLSHASEQDVRAALAMAHAHAGKGPRGKAKPL
ncbi:MAG: MmcQ/YjbR family DNA-binding protein [Candidatus Devosia phytovorans]|uniref:MmcQ/YjbR family DNA-binding protein n=1 Tax=Candidatus Devosia phytovorans TaxID=3121372 RepID=A0AAJ5VYG4_9HYPH|nr:MmcQ/YjbR family DNA-binding protein [Devosia sp.]WEK06180.1 MAG: MmcQ/YjbR family DNA-binding protein [Devosia sp.]